MKRFAKCLVAFVVLVGGVALADPKGGTGGVLAKSVVVLKR